MLTLRQTILLQKDNEFIEEYSQKCYNIYCENYGEKLKISQQQYSSVLLL